MISAISGYNPYSTYGAYGAYGMSYTNRTARPQGADQAQYAQRSLVLTAHKTAQPDTPVQPVTPARPVIADEDPAQSGLLRFGSDPAEMAVRMRIQYPGDGAQQSNAAQGADKQAPIPGLPDKAAEDQAPIPGLPNKTAENQAPIPGLPSKTAEDQAPILGLKTGDEANPVAGESKSAQEVMEEGECQTCKERKYQDGSDDPGVSFKTPTNIAPDQAAAAVRGHENEHVVREQAKARQEDRKVVSQSATYHTDICPECGKVYVSGGTTRTVTKANNGEQLYQQPDQQDPSKAFAATA